MSRNPSGDEVFQVCMALNKTGYRCSLKAVHTVSINGEPYKLCGVHRSWTPKTHRANGGRPSNKRKLNSRQRLRNEKKRMVGRERCIFPNRAGDQCLAPISHRDEDDRPWCHYHWMQLDVATPEQRVAIQQRILEFQMFKAAGQEKINDEPFQKAGTRKLVKDMPTETQWLDGVKSYAESLTEDEDSIELKRDLDIHFMTSVKAARSDTKIGKKTFSIKKKVFLGMDVEHYTPNFRYDYLYLLFNQIRRAEATVVVLHQQLQRIELEDDELKRIENFGTMMSDKGEPVEFKNTTIRHAIPMEQKLRLFEVLTKQEGHLAKLLKQLEELPLTCLTVFRKMGVKWDRQAAMMVVEAIENERSLMIEGYSQELVEELPSTLDEVRRPLVKTASTQVVNVKSMAPLKDEDW